MLSPARLSVTWVNQSNAIEVRIIKFSPYFSPILLVFTLQVSSRNSDGSPELQSRIKEGWENEPFFRFKRQYFENGRRYGH